MTALVFRKVDNSAGADICLEEGCQRSGRFAVLINGLPILSDSKLSFYPHARICEKHRREWKKAWTELSGEKELQEVEAAIRDLKQKAPKRTEAIFALRAFGLSRDDIAHAMKGVGDGLDVEQILEGLCGDEREQVAA